jgi:hypothetical protein
MRRFLFAIALLGLSFGIAHGEGQFDGRWKGSWSVTSNAGLQGRTCRTYRGNIDMTVANGEVTGETTGHFNGSISGTVANDGKFTGKIGSFDMTGTFSRTRFSGRIATPNCVARVSARTVAG